MTRSGVLDAVGATTPSSLTFAGACECSGKRVSTALLGAQVASVGEFAYADAGEAGRTLLADWISPAAHAGGAQLPAQQMTLLTRPGRTRVSRRAEAAPRLEVCLRRLSWIAVPAHTWRAGSGRRAGAAIEAAFPGSSWPADPQSIGTELPSGSDDEWVRRMPFAEQP